MTGAWLLAVPALVPLVLTLVNTASWQRGRPGATAHKVSVCIPARDERATIAAVVTSALASGATEVVVCDDGSTDGTSEILAALAAEHPRLRVIDAPPLPSGWVGKVRACHLLSQAATYDTLVFVDADTQLTPTGLSRVVDLMQRNHAQVVTAVPRQQTGSPLEHLVVPLLHLTYTAWLPLFLVHRSSDPRFLAANGQVLAIHRAALDDIGGFAAIADQVVDDMALCRLAKTRGHRVVFADGHHIASCRMYRSARSVWEGFSKNIFEGLGESLMALVAVSSLYLAAFVLPYALAIVSIGTPALRPVAVTAVVATVLTRLVLAWRHRHALSSVVLHPVGVLVLVAIAWNSMRWSRSGQIRWAGRTYPRLSGRAAR